MNSNIDQSNIDQSGGSSLTGTELRPWQGAPGQAEQGKGGCGAQEGLEQAGRGRNGTGIARSWNAELGWCRE